MSDAPEETTEVVVSGNKFSIQFERSVSDGNYGSTKATVWLQGEVPVDADDTTLAEAAGRRLNVAAVTVFEHLGISSHFDADAGVVREDLAAVSAPRVQQALRGTPVATPGGGGGTGGLTIKNADEASPEPLPAWLLNEKLIKDGTITAIYDRRLTRDASRNQAWFAEAARKGEGHGKDGSAKGFWPPKD